MTDLSHLMTQRSNSPYERTVHDEQAEAQQQDNYDAGGCNNYVLQLGDFGRLSALCGRREEESSTSREVSELRESADLVCSCRQTDGGLSRREQGERL